MAAPDRPAPAAPTAPRDLRSWLGLLEERRELARVAREVGPVHEAAAVLSRLDGRRAVLFERLAGSRFPLAGNTVLDRRSLALALGCTPAEAAVTFGERSASPLPCAEVEASRAPVLANRLGPDLLEALPVCVHHELDAGRYLTSAVVVAGDGAGSANLSINRLQVTGPGELRALVLPGRLREILAAAERGDEALPVAILVGVDPLMLLASQHRHRPGVDELEVAGALAGAQLRVVRAPGVGIPVPAEAEFVIEGRIRPGERAPEGPFGEFPRTYGPEGPGYVVDVTAVWHRDQAVFQTILPAGREHLLIGALPREAHLLAHLRRLHPRVRCVRLTEGGACRLHAVVGLDQPGPGEAINTILSCFGANAMLKLVTVVDRDVDVFSDEEVELAVATRVQADRDVLVIPGGRGSSLDPSAPEGVTAKMGIVATVSPGEWQRHARIVVPGASELDLAEYLGAGWEDGPSALT